MGHLQAVTFITHLWSKYEHRFALALLLLTIPCLLSGQEVTATLTGVVTDSSGGVVAHATVTATNLDTNAAGSTTTGSSGDYVIPYLRPGKYRLTVAQPGFKTFEQSGFNLEINQRAKIDVSLSVGEVSEKIQITGEPPIIETEDSAIGKVIDNKSRNPRTNLSHPNLL